MFMFVCYDELFLFMFVCLFWFFVCLYLCNLPPEEEVVEVDSEAKFFFF